MESRFESDLVELSGDGNYLMICANRQMLFLDGVDPGKLALADVVSIASRDGAIVVRASDGADQLCPFPSVAEPELVELATRLEACVTAWRAPAE